MITFVTILFVLTALLLIGVVLVQQPKTSGGLFAGTGQSLLGTSGKTFWTKFTTVLAAVFMAICLLLAALPRYKQPGSSVVDTIEKQQKQQQEQQQQQSSQPPSASSQAAPNPQSNPAPGTLPGASHEKPSSGKKTHP